MRRAWCVIPVAAALVVAGCGSDGKDDGGGTGGGKGGAATIALFLPESKTTRYEAFDRPLFEGRVKQLCADCKIIYGNADQDATKQQSQVEGAITQGADVIVLDAVDAKAAAPLVNQARQRRIPVIAYDRLITNVEYSYFVSFDNVRVGQMQGQALLDALTARGTLGKGKIVMLNGAPTDPSSADYKKGAHQVLDGKVQIGREFDTPDWSPDKAQQQMEQAITALGRDTIVGVLSANDGMAGGAIAAMKRAGYKSLPPITGQDAELAAVQRILTGEQNMTVYLNIRAQAERSADLAVALARGEKPAAPQKVNNGTADIPAFLLAPTAVTKDKIKDTIIKDGFYPAAKICAGQVAAACKTAGLQ
ncbi:sugar ABC transporter substrate-binding protein [Actinomadura rudentiformis]|uniref:Sugar ABC transporter substrate-binding protein n=1 Tax=Actinomadura rudentiformis TaxID=359158 RepID=A0A6H9YAZ6_9ACTN|nr:sugar ABC transporter substrate-binding protein [Actinomadura rudentiformis]KAB2342421.1 sugar ABC transporter substrate-binding protein [Actinomadura rudentiformis]